MHSRYIGGLGVAALLGSMRHLAAKHEGDGTRTMRERHDYPPNPFLSRQVRRALARAAKKAEKK
jgi:hypothetical protein